VRQLQAVGVDDWSLGGSGWWPDSDGSRTAAAGLRQLGGSHFHPARLANLACSARTLHSHVGRALPVLLQLFKLRW